MKLTKAQRAALQGILDAENGGRFPTYYLNVWDFGSTTVNRLRHYGYIEVRKSLCYLTADGRAAAKE